jgi:hypothetical protein
MRIFDIESENVSSIKIPRENQLAWNVKEGVSFDIYLLPASSEEL